jgi:hypothetical protein
MKKTKQLIGIILLLFSFINESTSQIATVAGGGNSSGSGGSVSYSVGQVVYTPIASSSGTAIQGVQQPYEIFVVGVYEALMEIDLTVFPNPTLGSLQLTISETAFNDLSYQLFDMQGNLIDQKTITQTNTMLDLSGYAHATYVLHVSNNKQSIKSFQIIKN